jgi:hypothetical protein
LVDEKFRVESRDNDRTPSIRQIANLAGDEKVRLIASHEEVSVVGPLRPRGLQLACQLDPIDSILGDAEQAEGATAVCPHRNKTDADILCAEEPELEQRLRARGTKPGLLERLRQGTDVVRPAAVKLSESGPHDRHGRNDGQRREPEAEQGCEAKRKNCGDAASPAARKREQDRHEHERGERR